MKLSAKLLTYYLQKKYGAEASDNISSEPCLHYPMVFRERTRELFNIIYVVDSPVFSLPDHLLRRSMLVYTNCQPSEYARSKPNVCVVEGDVTANEVFLHLQGIFDLYAAWDEALVKSRLGNRPIQNLLDITAEHIISNPMTLMGMDFTVIATRGTNYGDLRNSILGTNEATFDLVNALKNDPNYEASLLKDGAFYYPGNHIAQPMLCVNIKRSQRTAFRLSINPGEVPLDSTFGFVLEHLTEYISHALATNTAVNRDSSHSMHQIFHNILSDPSADYVQVSQQLSALGWMSAHFYRCILVEVGSLDTKNLTLRSICSYIENAIPASCAVEHRGNAVVFINTDLCPLSENEISQRLAGFIRDSMLNAGYSRTLLGHFNFQRQYVQASLSLSVGRRQYPSRWIHHFNDIALTYILEQTTKKLPAYMLAHEKLLTLKNMADSTNSPLYHTLRVYLENHLNLTKTSEDLFIHRSTLLYRLEKIQNILHSDYNNPEELLYLMLSFRIMEQEKDS